MKDKILKLIEELEKQESYLISKYEEAISDENEDYFMGKWFEVNKIRKELLGKKFKEEIDFFLNRSLLKDKVKDI